MYFYTLGGPNDSTISSLDQQGAIGDVDSQIIGARVLSILNQINSIKIDKTIFDDPLYKILLDHTVEIPPQNVGRVNPFDPYYVAPVFTPVTRTPSASRR